MRGGNSENILETGDGGGGGLFSTEHSGRDWLGGRNLLFSTGGLADGALSGVPGTGPVRPGQPEGRPMEPTHP